jgi:hypothetical protein
VESLWRLKATVDVEPTLRRLASQSDVVYAALSSLQRTIGAHAMIPVLEKLLAESSDPTVKQAAARQMKRVRRKTG